MSAAERRAAAIDRLDGSAVDLLVVGGGIVGSRVTYEAAGHGLDVALVDLGDFGGATSSASSKLIHGGLRYLATGDVPLVRSLAVERRALMRAVAPHLVRPLPLLLAVERRHAARSAKLVAALALYGAIAWSRDEVPGLLRPEAARRLVPALDPSSVALCGIIHEAQTHDARLTLATVRGARALGATVLNHVGLVAFEHAGGRIVGALLRDCVTGHQLSLRCRAAVNASGAWVDPVRRLGDPTAPPIARLSRGVHALLRLDQPWRAGVAVFDELRTAIAVPWQGLLLVGATDVEHVGEPELSAPAPFEIADALRPFSELLEWATVDASRLVGAFAGMRVLPCGRGATSQAHRGHLVEVSRQGLVSVAGGKLTTHRRIAVDALRHLPTPLRPRRLQPSSAPLPGASGATRLPREIDRATASHLLALYGAEANLVAAYAETVPNALEPIAPGGPDIVAQAWFARDAEYAVTVDDVLCRRTTVAVRGLSDPRARDVVSAILQPAGRRETAPLAT